MSIAKWFKSIRERLNWSFIGVMVAIVFFIVTLILIFHERKPDISFEITNEANVLDVHKPLEDLTISFQGEDIQEKKLNLRIFTIHIENSGQADILQNHYDLDDVWGFQVQNGKIIEVRLMDSNSDYVKSKLNPQLLKENSVEFTKLIFERGKFFTLEILVLHKKDKLPEIIPLGKIAGIDRIIPVKSWLEKEKKTFLTELFYGNVLIQILRPIIYLIGIIIFLIVVILFGEKISDLRSKIKKESRKKRIEALLREKSPEEGSKKKILLDIYVEQGTEALKEFRTLLEDKDRLFIEMERDKQMSEMDKKLSELEKAKSKAEIIPLLEIRETMKLPHFLSRPSLISDLVKEGALTLGKDEKVLIDPELKQALDEILGYLENKEKK